MKARILVVNNEPAFLTLCKLALSLRGFDSVLTRDGLEGLKLFERHHKEIDLVVVDASLPKERGLQMVRGMFAVTPYSNVILMVGREPGNRAPDDLSTKCGLLSKPFSTGQLIQAIDKQLARSRSKSSAGG